MTSAVRSIEDAIRDSLFNDRQREKLNGGSFSIAFLCGIFVCLGLGLITYGTYLSLESQYSSQTAASMTGILSLVFALLIAGFVYATHKYQYLKKQKEKLKLFENFKDVLSLLDDEIGEPIRNNPKASVMIAALTGFLLEDRIF